MTPNESHRLRQLSTLMHRMHRMHEMRENDMLPAVDRNASTSWSSIQHMGVAGLFGAFGFLATIGIFYLGLSHQLAPVERDVGAGPRTARIDASRPAGAPERLGGISGLAPPGPATDSIALRDALGLLSAGQVNAARRQFMRLSPDKSVDVAWALARSFDPNFLATIGGADAAPDIDLAAHWYRTWHTIAVEQGHVTQNVSVERIIESMR